MLTPRVIPFLCAITFSTQVSAQDVWQWRTAVSAMTGHYADSMTLKNQSGLGLRISAEKDQTWGLTTGLQTTRIDMQPIVPTGQQIQDDWLLSAWVHAPSTAWPGRWTFQLDTYQSTHNASSSNSSDVRTWAPKITWLAFGQALKMDLGYAHSQYKDTDPIHQVSASVAVGFNDAKDWIQVRSTHINHLTPALALGHSRTRATDVKLTHLLSPHAAWTPTSITWGLERGQKIYALDVDAQYIYNLPMLNRGGENIAGTWKLNPQTTLNVQLSKNKYTADQPSTHSFTSSTLGIQLAKTW
jgi:hypothetical protein